MQRMQVYLGTFLLAFAMLALEVTLTRLLSVVTWYHLAFFAIATAMLGMTAGATVVFLNPRRFAEERLHENLAGACLRFTLVVPVALVLLCLVPLTMTVSLMTVCAMLVATVACAVPFFYAGIAITLLLTKYPLPIGRLYAADLAGASFGCLFVLAGLEVFDAPSLILLCGAVGALAGLVFAWRRTGPRLAGAAAAAVLLMTAAGLINARSPYLIRPLMVKGCLRPAHGYVCERWNSFSRVTVEPKKVGPPHYWGASPKAPSDPVEQHNMTIDGEAGTHVGRFASREDVEHLRYDVTNVAYYVAPKGPACIIGVGGGRDAQAALLFGQERVTAIDVNPIFVDLLRGRFRDFAGLAGRDDVELVVDEARSYLSRTDERFSLVQMSLIDTWAATGAGAFSLSENSLYTVEAWSVFLERLRDDGVFTVSRWYNPGNLGETGRLMGLAVASLLRAGVRDPADHVALITCGKVSTLLISRRPLPAATVARLREVCAELEYDAAVLPGEAPPHEALREILACRSMDELRRVAARRPLRCDPPTDEDPYFFNMLRLSHVDAAFRSEAGVYQGNLKATLTLVGLIGSLLLVAGATVLVPLWLRGRSTRGDCPDSRAAKMGRSPSPRGISDFSRSENGTVPVDSQPVLWAGVAYFSLIGAGFMLTEIALIQRLSVLLSHPVYALGILLFTMILSTGVGSFLSERLPLVRRPWVFLYPLLAVGAILGVRFLLSALLAGMITSPMSLKILVAVAVVFPMGLVMGFFFPTGMRLVRAVGSDETPWYWALNGVFGVLASAMAVFVSIFLGISANFYLAAGCYALLVACNASLARRGSVWQARVSVPRPAALRRTPAPCDAAAELV
jgi:hypothetical protein